MSTQQEKDPFCKIRDKELPADVLFEDEDLMVIKNIAPKTPVHYLVIPKKHIATINAITQEDVELLGKMMFAAQKAARELNINNGYKLSFNVEKGGGQEVFHIHLHLVGGWE